MVMFNKKFQYISAKLISLAKKYNCFNGSLVLSKKSLLLYRSNKIDIAKRNIEAENNSDYVSIKFWNKDIGKYGVDATEAIEQADEWCYEHGKTLYFPSGQYCISKSIIKKSRWLGDGAPELAPFPQVDDDKIYLRPGYKYKLPGSSIILTSSSSLSSVVTTRSDIFSSMTYAIKTNERLPGNMSGIGILMDIDIFDEKGNLTDVNSDNRIECDVGLLIDDSSASDFPNLSVFGYWNKAGICIWSHGIGDNPDYIKFGFGSTMGYYGLAIIGNDSQAGRGPGVSGTQFFGFQLFGNDHHSRCPQNLKNYQTNSFGHLLFIDGNTGAVNASLNGHEFIGGGWRTYSNRPVVLDNCSNLHLINVPFEFSTIANQPDTVDTKFIGTSQTRNINIMNSRNISYAMWDHAEFGGVVDKLMIFSPYFGDMTIGAKGAYVRVLATGGGNDPRIQFTRNTASSESGFVMRMDVSESDAFTMTQNGSVIGKIDIVTGAASFKRTLLWPVGSPLVVSNGKITISQNNHAVSAIGSPVVNQIEGGIEGEMVQLTKSGSGTLIITKGGNIVTGEDIVMNAVSDVLTLVKRGKNWLVKSFSNNA